MHESVPETVNCSLDRLRQLGDVWMFILTFPTVLIMSSSGASASCQRARGRVGSDRAKVIEPARTNGLIAAV
jgi:hypothetical protein